MKMLYNCKEFVINQSEICRNPFRRRMADSFLKSKKMPKSAIDFIYKKCKIKLRKNINIRW